MVLRVMYSSAVASVREDAGCSTEESSCPVGLKQKCSCIATYCSCSRLSVHRMGANSDGTGNACTDSFYTLARDFAVPPRSSQPNPWTFSVCSGPEIRSHL